MSQMRFYQNLQTSFKFHRQSYQLLYQKKNNLHLEMILQNQAFVNHSSAFKQLPSFAVFLLLDLCQLHQEQPSNSFLNPSHYFAHQASIAAVNLNYPVRPSTVWKLPFEICFQFKVLHPCKHVLFFAKFGHYRFVLILQQLNFRIYCQTRILFKVFGLISPLTHHYPS